MWHIDSHDFSSSIRCQVHTWYNDVDVWHEVYGRDTQADVSESSLLSGFKNCVMTDKAVLSESLN